MQFVSNGPDIPEALLQVHEEGSVVFFCGAGISYPAKLPSFEGLVEAIYANCGDVAKGLEVASIAKKQYDTTLELLERRLQSGRTVVRKALAESLVPNLRAKGATDTHKALLQLARSHSNALRLVTTNFDRIFEIVAKRQKLQINSAVAPMLPVPKSRWNNLVYLHGLIAQTKDSGSLDHLIVTSGDFGRAYLTERWAARFVSELFRNYVVCFVGYSINDPVMRYMMDALAADRVLGERTNEAYAFGDCHPGDEATATAEWRAKGVTPILYHVPSGTHDHSRLHGTLKAWANTYRDGIGGREQIVTTYAMSVPSTSTKEDDFVGRVLWAISHDTGLPAKRFAEVVPAPAIEWLDVFSQPRYRHEDLVRFGVMPNAKTNPTLEFSVVKRPTPYTLAQDMSLVTSRPPQYSGWDKPMHQLARWLLRYLDHPKLIRWVAKSGGHLDGFLASMIEHEISKFAALEAKGDIEEIARVKAASPYAIPRPAIRPLWRLLLNGYAKHPSSFTSLYQWRDQLHTEGLTGSLRMKLRELLAPRITLREPYRWSSDSETYENSERLKDLIDWELQLAEDHVESALGEMKKSERWREIQPLLIEDFELLLGDALGLLKELGDANEFSDRSHWDLPSISSHWQNRGFREWIVLIELVRDAWLAVLNSQPDHARNIACAWFERPFPTFKRLALFAASQDGCIPPEEWAGWLLMDNSRWLWRIDTRREVMRLLVLQGSQLAAGIQAQIEAAILSGPPRDDYRDDLLEDEWKSIVDESKWIRLAKLQSSGLKLGASAMTSLTELTKAYPHLKFRAHEREEFSHWMTGTGDPDYEVPGAADPAPRDRRKLVQWLKKARPESRFHEDDGWAELCRTGVYYAMLALHDLAKEGIWQSKRWQTALSVWGGKDLAPRTWRTVSKSLLKMPDEVFGESASSISWWLEAASEKLSRFDRDFLHLCRRLLTLRNFGDLQEIKTLTNAINHPIGRTTQALLNVWLKQDLKDGMTLGEPIEPLFAKICDAEAEYFRAGKMLLASRVITLFRVDRKWTEAHVLPRFNWESGSAEARIWWEGFLWSPRLYLPLFIAWKAAFLDAGRHYRDFHEQHRNLVALLTYAALEGIETYTYSDFRTVFSELPHDALDQAAEVMAQALEGAGGQKEAYWDNRFAPFWNVVWPKSATVASERIAVAFARICVVAGTRFREALAATFGWLQPLTHPYQIFKLLHESSLCQKQPREALQFLAAIVNEQTYLSKELGQCLDQISEALPELKRDRRYQTLKVFCEQREYG